MAFIRELNKAVILVPKTGTKTIQHVSDLLGTTDFDDHITQAEMRAGITAKYPDLVSATQFAVNIRNPIDRFVSACNFAVGNAPANWPASRLVAKVYEEKRPLFFSSQSYWIEPGAILFNFESMEICRWLGWTDEIPKLNTGLKRWTRQEIESEPLFNDIMERFTDDWLLWEQVI